MESRSPSTSQKRRRTLAEKIERIGLMTHENHPLTLESERRKATSIVYHIEREVDHFQNKWLKTVSEDSIEEWIEFLRVLRLATPGSRSKSKNMTWLNFKEFGDFLIRVRSETDVALTQRRLFNQMEKIVTRGKIFEIIVPDSRKKLEEAVDNHIHKYCLSFCYESDAENLITVQEYENSINNWREEVKEGLKFIDQRYKEYQDYINRISFDGYIKTYGQVLQMMKDVLESFPHVCSPVRDWVVADEVYTRKLQDEENRYREEQKEIAGLLRKRFQDSQDQKRKLKRAGFDSKKIGDKLHGVLMERKSVRRKEMTFQDTLNFIEDEIEISKYELEDTLRKLRSRESNQPKVYEALTKRVDYLKNEVVELEKRRKLMKDNIMQCKKERYRVQKQIHELKSVFDDSVINNKKMAANAGKSHLSSHDLMEKQKQLVQKINAARRIREIKLHPLTVKKVHAYGYSPGLIIDLSEKFDDAIKQASNGIGKEWGVVNCKLPLKTSNPDSIIHSLHQDDMKGSVKSMDKWQRLSQATSRKTLARSLNSMALKHKAQREIIVC